MASTWISRPELERLIGRECAEVLCRLLGGVSLYVPRTPDVKSKLGRALDAASLRALCTAYGGEQITVPNGHKVEPYKWQAIALLDSGASCRDIALQLGITERYVRHLARLGQPKARQLSLFDEGG